ncbi:ABC transporter permease [Streptomyces sp. NPDC101733]|uniref:ABC transporter permease n=1 Tax=unclassified Streptomyces TaxID=2593676 RepID=UPI0038076E58
MPLDSGVWAYLAHPGETSPMPATGVLPEGVLRDDYPPPPRSWYPLAPHHDVFAYTLVGLPAARAPRPRALAPGADARAYTEAVEALEPGLRASVLDSGNAGAATVITFATVFTVLLTLVASLDVFNTVLLNTRERRRDLGMLKSIGMTPRQVVVMTVTSVAGLGAVGGLLGIPLGIAAHRLVVDHVGVVDFPEYMKDVWHAPQLAAMLLSGVVIAILGALVPAQSAARMTIATVLHTE